LMVLCVVRSLNAAETDVLKAQQARVEIVRTAAPTVVAIFSADGNGGGSGVLISPDGYALSNFHVTSATGEFMKCGLNDGKLYDAVIVGIDPTGDVAVIKLLGREDFPHAPLGDSDKLAVGDWTYAMGNPFLTSNRPSRRESSAGCTGISTRPGRCSNTRTASRSIRRSTPVTRAGRCSMRRENWSASTDGSRSRSGVV
jgi:hypothetical protein